MGIKSQCNNCKKKYECTGSDRFYMYQRIRWSVNNISVYCEDENDKSCKAKLIEQIENIELPIEIKCKHFERKGTKVKPKKISG